MFDKTFHFFNSGGFHLLPKLLTRCLHATAAAARAAELKARNRKVAIYMASVVTAVLGVSYAAVPLYKVFCQVRQDSDGRWFVCCAGGGGRSTCAQLAC